MSNPIYINDTELAGDLKQLYNDMRTELFPIITPLFASIKKEGRGGPKRLNWGGQGAYFDVVLNPPVNWGVNNAGELPPSSQTTEVQGNLGPVRFYMRRQFDNLAIVGTSSKQAAFISLRQKIANEFSGGMRLGMQEMLQGNGTGVRGIVSGTTGSPVSACTVISPYGVSNAGQGGLWLYKGMYIAIRDTTGATLRGKTYIQNVSNSGDTASLTFSSTIAGVIATDVIVAATANNDSYGQYANGLMNITNRGAAYNTLHAINAATAGQERWDATRFTAGTDTDTTAPTEMDVWKLSTAIAAKSGADATMNPKEFIIVTTFGIKQQLIQNTLAQRTNPVTGTQKVALPGGYEADALLGIPLIADSYVPAGTLYLIHLPSLFWIDAADWSPVQYENSGAVRWIDGYDAFETSWKSYMNFGTDKRNAHGSIIGYTDTQRFTPVV